MKKTLISSTSLVDLTDAEALNEIANSGHWRRANLNLLRDMRSKIHYRSSSLEASGVTSARIDTNLFIAGDYLTAGSQNGALLSGRLAAMESLAN